MPVLDLPDIADDPWLACVWREFRAGRLDLSHLRVLVVLREFRDDRGISQPTYDRLAQRAGCGTGAARTALDKARALGLVSWRVRHHGSSLYRLRLPAVRP
jgi:hypothetical protein